MQHVEVNHPFIVQLLGLSITGVSGGEKEPAHVEESDEMFSVKASFVMEYMPNGSLDNVVEAKFSERKPFDCFAFTIRALKEAAMGM